MGKRFIVWASFSVVAIGVVLGGLYALLVPGLSSARTEPRLAETVIATWLLHQSVPNAAKMSANPLGADPADVTAGRDLYRQKCEHRMDIAPQAAGLLAASLGLSRMYADDLAQLEAGFALYDAFYRWCRDAVEETHTAHSKRPGG